MSRSGYTDDCDDYRDIAMWRGRIASAIRGKRGQAFLREMLAALDALPEKRLIQEELQIDGEVCAIGSVLLRRGVDMTGLDPENHRKLGNLCNISASLVQEIEFINDDDFGPEESPEHRWKRVRGWVVGNINEPKP